MKPVRSWSFLLLVALAFVDGEKTEAFSSRFGSTNKSRRGLKDLSTKLESGNDNPVRSQRAFQNLSTRLASENDNIRGGGGDESSFQRFLKKCAGVQAKPPPSSTWAESFHTFAGVAVNLLVLTHMNTQLVNTYGQGASIVLGPFGAFCTLCYALPGAPASQPKSAILGQALSLSLAILLKKIPLSPIWTTETRISITTALAIGLMSKIGCAHPPAGAATLLFASNDKLGWSHMGILLLANVVTIIVSTIINNLSSSRQYPTFWGLGSAEKEAK